jgi:ABC-2 type transport system ATP-binding protein
MGVIETTRLTKLYPRVRALDELTVDIPGGAVGLLGPNGAGKSTLIKTLLGFVRPTSGTARVFGLDPLRAPLSVRRGIGYMPEVESFIPGMTAVDYVYLAARLTGLRHADAMQRTHMVLNYTGVHEERHRTLETHSTGMKQKVKFAQALVHHPRLLLLDEPTAGLDPRARQEMLGLIRDVARGQGIDVVLSTHILHDVESVCDRVVILHRGKLAAHEEIGKRTASAETAYEVQVKGDREAFVRNLREAGLECSETEESGVRVSPAKGTSSILRAAVAAGVQLRRLVPAQERLEDLFSRMLEER